MTDMTRFLRLVLIGTASFVFLSAGGMSRSVRDRTATEAFLRTAKIVDREPLPIGVTHSHRLTLSDGERTLRAVWKTIDESRPIKRFDRGLPELGFSDTYKNEVAAYELDKILDLDMVPPTVERRIGRQLGSLQLWIDGCMTEGERVKRKIQPPDPVAWSEQAYKIRLFRQLIHDTDWENASNVLCDRDFRVWSVDHSRAFRTQKVLQEQTYLRRFSRSLLDRLERLDRETLDRTLSPWLSPAKLDALLIRRDLILSHARGLVAEHGEESILYP